MLSFNGMRNILVFAIFVVVTISDARHGKHGKLLFYLYLYCSLDTDIDVQKKKSFIFLSFFVLNKTA